MEFPPSLLVNTLSNNTFFYMPSRDCKFKLITNNCVHYIQSFHLVQTLNKETMLVDCTENANSLNLIPAIKKHFRTRISGLFT